MSEPLLRAERLTLAYDHRAVVHELDLVIPRGRVTAVVGANGCGKSTLLRALARLLAPRAGAVLVLVSDLAGRLLFAPTEIPVGLVTSIIAAPYFLLLLRRAHRVGVMG